MRRLILAALLTAPVAASAGELFDDPEPYFRAGWGINTTDLYSDRDTFGHTPWDEPVAEAAVGVETEGGLSIELRHMSNTQAPDVGFNWIGVSYKIGGQ